MAFLLNILWPAEILRHTEAFEERLYRSASTCKVLLGFWVRAPPSQTLQLLFYTKLKGSWEHTMARLSLVTGFTPGGKNAVTSLGHPSVMAYNLQDGKFTKNAFFLPYSRSALLGRISRDMFSAVQVRELPTSVKPGHHLLCCSW